MALGLACSQGWWRSCSAAAIFPRGGAAPGVSESRGSLGARSRPPGPEDGAEAAKTRATTTTPDPKGWLAGLGLEGAEVAAVCFPSLVSGRK